MGMKIWNMRVKKSWFRENLKIQSKDIDLRISGRNINEMKTLHAIKDPFSLFRCLAGWIFNGHFYWIWASFEISIWFGNLFLPGNSSRNHDACCWDTSIIVVNVKRLSLPPPHPQRHFSSCLFFHSLFPFKYFIYIHFPFPLNVENKKNVYFR